MSNTKSAEEMFSDLGFNYWDYPGTIEYSISDNEEIVIGPNTILFEFLLPLSPVMILLPSKEAEPSNDENL